MSTVRIPWEHLLPGDADLADGWQIRFELDQHATGLVVADEIQASE